MLLRTCRCKKERNRSDHEKIAAAGQRESNMWQPHIQQLIRIITLRRRTNQIEPYDSIVWMICCIDVYALLSSSGSGAFTEELLKNNMFPTPERSLTPLSLDQHPVFHSEEECFFPGILRLNHEVLLVALKVGQLARDLRGETSKRISENEESSISNPAYLINRQTRINSLRRFMQNAQNKWRSDFPGYGSWFDGSKPLPRRVFSWAMHVCILFKPTDRTNIC